MVKAVVLAAGKGTRLRPYTNVLPKPLLPLGGTPILETLVRQLVHYGYDEIIVTSHYLTNVIGTYLPSLQARFDGVNIRHVPQDALMGTSGGLSAIEGLADDGPFLVMNGDLLCTMDFGEMMAAHKRNGDAALTVGLYSQEVPIKLGVLQTDDNGDVTGYLEKPTYHFDISMGVYIYAPETLAYVPPHDWLDAPDLVKTLIADGKRVATHRFEGYWLDVGTMDDFTAAGEVFAQERTKFLPDEG